MRGWSVWVVGAVLGVSAAALGEEGKTTTVSEALEGLEGDVAIVSIGAGWCKPCLRAWEDMQLWGAKHPGNGVRLLGVSVDEEPQMLAKSVEKYALKLPIVRDSDGRIMEPAAKVIGKNGTVPMTFLIGPDGSVYRACVGWRPDDPKWTELLEAAGKLADDPKSVQPSVDKPTKLRALIPKTDKKPKPAK